MTTQDNCNYCATITHVTSKNLFTKYNHTTAEVTHHTKSEHGSCGRSKQSPLDGSTQPLQKTGETGVPADTHHIWPLGAGGVIYRRIGVKKQRATTSTHQKKKKRLTHKTVQPEHGRDHLPGEREDAHPDTGDGDLLQKLVELVVRERCREMETSVNSRRLSNRMKYNTGRASNHTHLS